MIIHKEELSMSEFARFSSILETLLLLESQYLPLVSKKYGRDCSLDINISPFRNRSIWPTQIMEFLEKSGLGNYLQQILSQRSLHSPIVMVRFWPTGTPFVPLLYKGRMTLMLTGTATSYSSIKFARLGGLHPAIPKCDIAAQDGQPP